MKGGLCVPTQLMKTLPYTYALVRYVDDMFYVLEEC